ncbi:hypothetical protein GCK72_021186 [Caenorhabditis remanei]|uniref:F-box domain-containing protein n=1 Tax=Caenorhabditis remanei TaxID=31234 RepID=A0A6A5GIW1_CAERE|nr:hypothetical protein GCK72_021186 [Caenorhabditis remanei]KAF1754623.1 hypothetical protein GCK72_021186 [Caenorhabditis remanei]
MAEILARNPIALRRFIVYEVLGKVPVFEAYNNFCKRFGEDVMNYVDYEFWYYRALHGELDVNYDKSVTPRQPALLELPMEMLWSIFEKASPIERLIVRKVCTRLQTCIDTMYNKIDGIRYNSAYGPVEIKYEEEVVRYQGNTDCSVYRLFRQPLHRPAVVKNVDQVELAIRDLSIPFRNPNLRLKSLDIHVDFDRMPRFQQVFESLNHQLHVEKLTFRTWKRMEETMILPFLKSRTLKKITIYMWESDEPMREKMGRLGQITQCREAEMLKIHGKYGENFPIDCFLNCHGLTLSDYRSFIRAETTIKFIGVLQTSTVLESFLVEKKDSEELLKAIRDGGRPLWNGVETRLGSCIFKIPIANSDKFWKLDLSGKMVHLERQ